MTFKPLRLIWLIVLAGTLPCDGQDRPKELLAELGREPVYSSNPKYCLLAIGPGSTARFWLVQDGAVLYVDRNGNGDLTEQGEKIVGELSPFGDQGCYRFDVGQLRVGDRVHKSLTIETMKLDKFVDRNSHGKAFLAKEPKALGYAISIDLDAAPWKGTGTDRRVAAFAGPADATGILQWSDRPASAPIVHFLGDLQVTLKEPYKLTVGRTSEIYLGVGTRGTGPGSTTFLEYSGVVPTGANPIVEMEFPSGNSNQAVTRQKYELKHRC